MLRLLSLIFLLSELLPIISRDHNETIGTQSKKSVGEEPRTGEVCKFLGQNITTRRQVIRFPDNFNMSDVLTVKANRGTAERGYLFYLYKLEQSADRWMFYLWHGKYLSTYGVHTSGENKIQIQDMKSVMKVQIFHNITADILSIITPNSTTKINSSLDMILQFNTIEIFTPSRFGSYEYISICRPKEPKVELTVPPQPYTLGSTVTLQCTITGPPFLSGYWTKDNTEVISSRTTELQSVLDDSEAEHRLGLKVIFSKFHVNHHLGLYRCHANSSIMAPNKTINQSIEVSYSAPIKITEVRAYINDIQPSSKDLHLESRRVPD